jgi:hypothetical protein
MREALRFFLLGVVMNYPWELVQSPLYRGMGAVTPWWHCFVASIGDGAMVAVIYLVGVAVLGRRDWFRRPQLAGYAVMLATGLSLAIIRRTARAVDRALGIPILDADPPGFDVGVG